MELVQWTSNRLTAQDRRGVAAALQLRHACQPRYPPLRAQEGANVAKNCGRNRRLGTCRLMLHAPTVPPQRAPNSYPPASARGHQPGNGVIATRDPATGTRAALPSASRGNSAALELPVEYVVFEQQERGRRNECRAIDVVFARSHPCGAAVSAFTAALCRRSRALMRCRPARKLHDGRNRSHRRAHFSRARAITFVSDPHVETRNCT